MSFITAGSSEHQELQRHLIETVQHALTITGTPGAAVAVLLDQQPIVVSGVGFRDIQQRAALEADARFYIYSVTKTVIATAILQLVEQGRIVLDAPVQSYLPQIPFDTPVTIRQLLNHTGGLPDYYGSLPAYFEAVKADSTQPWTPDQFLTHTLSSGFVFAPGAGWRYSNIGFLLLRQVLEAVAQTSLRKALHQQIFAPLDLQHTFVAETLDDVQELTPGYSAFFGSDADVQDIHALYHPGWVAHGVIVSTALELARVVEALFTGRLISPQSLAMMLEPVLVPYTHPLFQQPAYGLGLMIDPQSRYGIIAGHGGGGPGYSAAALHVPKCHGHRITSIVLANRDQDELGLQVAFELIAILSNALAD